MTTARDAVREFRAMLTEARVSTGVIDAMLDTYEASLPEPWHIARSHDLVAVTTPEGVTHHINVCELGSARAAKLFNVMAEGLGL